MRQLIKAILKTGSGAVGNLLLGVVSVKIMAVMLGPSGTGLYSLIRQVIITLASLGSGGQTALIQGIASKEDVKRDSYIRTTFWLYLFAAIISVLMIQVFASNISSIIFDKADENMIFLIRWMALPVFLLHVYTYCKSMLNGFRAIGRLAIIEMLGPLLILMLTYPVCIYVSEGYALAFIWMFSAAQLLMIISSIFILKTNGWLKSLNHWRTIYPDKTDSRYFFNIASTTIITSAIGTGTLLSIRAMIASNNGLSQLGFFDLSWTLSGSYVMLLLGSFGTYYTPTLIQAKGIFERAALVNRVIRLTTLLMIPMIVMVIVLKPLLVNILYSDKYTQSLEMIRWMLIGDYLKISSWILATTVVVNGDMKIYFWTEFFWYAGFLLFSAISIYIFDEPQGISIAFILLYLILCIYYLGYVKKSYDMKISQDLARPWLMGFVLVIFASIQNWNSTKIDWINSFLWVLGSLLLVMALLTRSERTNIIDIVRTKIIRS